MNDAERIGSAPAGRIAALLGPGIPGALVGELVGSARFALRLRAAAAGRLGALPALDARQAAALALDADGLRDIIHQAGAVWHAAALARVVDGAARREVLAALGLPAYARAMEARALAPGDLSAELPLDGDLAEAAATEGEGCWAAWRDAQPAPVASRLSLLGPDVEPRRDHIAFGPPIVAWLLDRT